MLLRIALIVVIAAGLGAAAYSHFQVAGKISSLNTNLEETKTSLEQSQTAEKKARSEASNAKKELDRTSKELATATNSLAIKTAKANEQEQRANKSAAELESTTKERNDALAELAAWKATGLTSDQVSNVVATLKKTITERDAFVEENDVLMRNNNKLQTKLKIYEIENYVPPLPSGLTGKIIAVDPKWEFVVLNIGSDQGVLERGEMLVNRNGKLAAKVRISSVERTRSIANILPEWKQTDVREGDQVITPNQNQ